MKNRLVDDAFNNCDTAAQSAPNKHFEVAPTDMPWNAPTAAANSQHKEH